jgi:hypothetical protein
MKPEAHREIADRILRSLAKCGAQDYEMKIEGAMLAGTHLLNALLHDTGVTAPDRDVMHTYLLTINEYRRLCVAANPLVTALSEIEDLRPPFVRGNAPGGEAAAGRALALLAMLRAEADARRGNARSR